MKPGYIIVVLWAGLVAAVAAEGTVPKQTSVQRLERERLQAVNQARLRFARERQVLTNFGVYEDFRAVLHVHAEDSNHTKGTRAEVLAAAKRTGVQIVMFTDHRGPKPETWHGLREGVLFIAGSEDDTWLRFPKFDAERKPLADGALKFLTHVEERYDADTAGLQGMEICNRHTDAKLDKEFQAYLFGAAVNPEAWAKLTNNFVAFPDEVFAAGTGYWPDIFAKWDRETQQRRLTGIAANDAHQNQIFNGFTFDPYEVSFRNLCTHILARELTEADVRQSLQDGHVYVSHDWLCDPTGFKFVAVNNLGLFDMGDPVPMMSKTRLEAQTPLPAHLKLIHKGAMVHETNGTRLTFRAEEPGPYRLEAWLTVDGEERPWIYTNPIYLEKPSLATLANLRLPVSELAANVEVKKDMAYHNPADDEPKHKLDLYLPRDKGPFPVLLFIHGGAWKSGDRSQYPSVANRFAKEGIAVAVMSYRLAPEHKHPAQIEDAAAAFAWVHRHIAEYGGDTNRLFVGGHSAGGHLAALLALDESYLKAHELSSRHIRGVICLSGVFNVNDGEKDSRVFGKEETVKKLASPITHVKAAAPPFLLTYCQWDYFLLPYQARQFHAALQKAGVSSELVYVPRLDHITEMFSISHEDDVNAQAILRFIRSGPAEAVARRP
jgi:acetyl esterase/lipase